MKLSDCLDKFLTELEIRGLSDKTIKVYKSAIRDFIKVVGDKECKDVNEKDYMKWITYRLRRGFDRGIRGNSKSTLHYYAIFVRKFLRWLGLASLPGIPQKRSQLPEILTQEEVERLFAHAKDLTDLLILGLLFESGLRASEALNLKKKDIDLFRREMRVTGKYGKQRIVFIGPITYQILQLVLPQLRPEDKLLNMTYQALYKRLKTLARRAGVEQRKVRPHILRHTFATTALRRGMSLPALQRLLGHNDIKVTQVYLHLVTEDIRREYERAWTAGRPGDPRFTQPPTAAVTGVAAPSTPPLLSSAQQGFNEPLPPSFPVGVEHHSLPSNEVGQVQYQVRNNVGEHWNGQGQQGIHNPAIPQHYYSNQQAYWSGYQGYPNSNPTHLIQQPFPPQQVNQSFPVSDQSKARGRGLA